MVIKALISSPSRLTPVSNPVSRAFKRWTSSRVLWLNRLLTSQHDISYALRPWRLWTQDRKALQCFPDETRVKILITTPLPDAAHGHLLTLRSAQKTSRLQLNFFSAESISWLMRSLIVTQPFSVAWCVTCQKGYARRPWKNVAEYLSS